MCEAMFRQPAGATEENYANFVRTASLLSELSVSEHGSRAVMLYQASVCPQQ